MFASILSSRGAACRSRYIDGQVQVRHPEHALSAGPVDSTICSVNREDASRIHLSSDRAGVARVSAHYIHTPPSMAHLHRSRLSGWSANAGINEWAAVE